MKGSNKQAAPATTVLEPYRPRRRFGVLLASQPTRQSGRVSSSALSLGIHTAVIASAVWATMSLGQEPESNDPEVVEVGIEQELPPPPPPPPPPVDAPPPTETEIPFGFKTFDMPTMIPPEIPPPSLRPFNAGDYIGIGIEGGSGDGRRMTQVDSVVARDQGGGDGAPAFTPMTVRPELLNRAEVGRSLEREYPAVLRDSNIGGTVQLWALVNTEGGVIETRINTSSGQPLLDKAAENIARVMRFSPAFNFDQKVTVWVSVPITFKVGSVR